MMLQHTTHAPGRAATNLPAINSALADEASADELSNFCDVMLRSLSPNEASAPALPAKAAVATAARRQPASDAVNPADVVNGLAALLLAPQAPLTPVTTEAGTLLPQGTSSASTEAAAVAPGDLLGLAADVVTPALTVDGPHSATEPVHTAARPGVGAAQLASTLARLPKEVAEQSTSADALPAAEIMAQAQAEPEPQAEPTGSVQTRQERSAARMRQSYAPQFPLPPQLNAANLQAPLALAPGHESPPARDSATPPAAAATVPIASSRQPRLAPDSSLPAAAAAPAPAMADAAAATTATAPTRPMPDAPPALNASASVLGANLNLERTAERPALQPATVGAMARMNPPQAATPLDFDPALSSEPAVKDNSGLLPAGATRSRGNARAAATAGAAPLAPTRQTSRTESLQTMLHVAEVTPRDPTNQSLDGDAAASQQSLLNDSAPPAAASNADSATAATASLGASPVLLHHPGPGAVAASSAYVSQGGVDVPTSYATLSPPVGSPEWDKALSQQVLRLHSSGHQVTELQVNPPGLGPIKITMDMNDRQMQLLFVSEHASVRAAVEAAVPELRASLAHNGISLGNTSVHSDNPSQSAFTPAQGSASGQRGYPRGPMPERSSGAAHAAAGARRQRHGGSVDTYA